MPPATKTAPKEADRELFKPQATGGVLSVDDIADNYDPTASVKMLEARTRNPFADYPIKLIEARFFPRDSLLDAMSKEDLLEYCVRNELFAKGWVIKREIPNNQGDRHPKVVSIKTDWDEKRIVAFIDKKQTHVFPSHHLVFCNLPSKKEGIPHIFNAKSWITSRFRSVWFDMSWPLPTPADPYREGRPMQCSIVDDDSIRAQMFFERQSRTGKVIMRQINNMPVYRMLQDDEAKSLPILRSIFTIGTRGSADLQRWEREEKGLPDLD